MSEVKRLTRKEEWGGFVNTDLLPVEGGCNLLCLTDRQVAIIRSFVFPAVRWPTRWVTPLHGELYDTDPVTFALLADEIDDLDLEVNGGHNVPCQELADALGDLITIANSAGSIGSVLASLPDADWLPTVAETPPEEGVPPDGFDTWDAYLTWKCQAAWAVWHELDRAMTMLEGFYGLMVTASVIVPTIFAFTAISWVAVPVSGVAILVVSILAMVAVWGSDVLIMDQMRTWWSDHQAAIVCQLYNTADAATALTALGDNIEDAIQAIEWGALLPFAGPLGDALAAVVGVFQNNSLVNPLFKLITGVVLIEVECPCEQAFQNQFYHFTEDLEGWQWALQVDGGGLTWTHGWENPGALGADGQDSDAGQFQDKSVGTGAFSQAHFYFDFPSGAEPLAQSGMRFQLDVCQTGGSGIFVEIKYTDQTEDNSYYSNVVGWSTLYHQVPSGSIGKHIRQISLAHNQGQHSNDRYVAIDNARLWIP